VAVRAGGHSVAGLSLVDDGLVLDVRGIDEVAVDPTARTARVGGGATWAPVDAATQAHGLATTGGRVSNTGVVGLTIGGGSGWLERKHGLACDNLLAAELVTADGRFVRASADENPDLFWALHGGGGNFGVATAFTFALHELSTVSAALLIFPAVDGPRVARAFRDFLAVAPDEVGGGFFYLTGPAEDWVPTELHGVLSTLMLVVYAGPLEQARPVLEPVLTLGQVGEYVAELSYADLQCMLDDPPGYRNHWSAEHLTAFPDEAVDVFCARASELIVPSPSVHVLFPQGGAVSRGPSHWPIPWRTAAWVAHPFGMWSDPAQDERARNWARAVREDLRQWSAGAVYLNFIGEEGPDRLLAGLGAANVRRLGAVKAEWDPANLFRSNHNIRPEQAAGQLS
jgi:FAD/FMN-containing dehydrogenase